jgi:Tol biopolymer transport system component
MSNNTSPRSMFLGFLALFGTLGCKDSWERDLVAKGFAHRSSDTPIAWDSSEDLFVLHHDYWQADANMTAADCKRSGLYKIDIHGSTMPVRVGRELCEIRDGNNIDISPDKNYVAYSEAGVLRLVDLQRGRSTAFPNAHFAAADLPAWSPNGLLIAFVATTGDHNEGLVVMNTDGSGAVLRRVLARRRAESRPSWSPDMSNIVLSVYPSDSAPYISRGEVVVVDTTGRNMRTIASGYQPTWGPRGDWIAYISVSFHLTSASASASNKGPVRTWVSSLRLVRPDGSNDHELYASVDTATVETLARMVSGAPWGRLVWSPDGQRLAFSRRFEGGATVWAIGVNRSGLIKLSIVQRGG